MLWIWNDLFRNRIQIRLYLKNTGKSYSLYEFRIRPLNFWAYYKCLRACYSLSSCLLFLLNNGLHSSFLANHALSSSLSSLFSSLSFFKPTLSFFFVFLQTLPYLSFCLTSNLALSSFLSFFKPYLIFLFVLPLILPYLPD